MYNRGTGENVICSVCGVKGHMKERCWTVVGYPKWHPKYKQPYRGKEILGDGNEITVEQLEQLLKNILGGHKIVVNSAHSEEEVDNNFAGFAGMVSCICANEKIGLQTLEQVII